MSIEEARGRTSTGAKKKKYTKKMRKVRRKGGNKEKVFGCDLLEHLAASSQESK